MSHITESAREKIIHEIHRSGHLLGQRHYDADLWGAEDLDAYGAWENTGEYGWIWRPNITVINVYNDWAPYRYGSWVWCSPYGWTWVGEEPFGWATYHYGRWTRLRNIGWVWVPGDEWAPDVVQCRLPRWPH